MAIEVVHLDKEESKVKMDGVLIGWMRYERLILIKYVDVNVLDKSSQK